MQGQRVNKKVPFQWVLPVLVTAAVMVAVLLLFELLGGNLAGVWAGLANQEAAASELVEEAAARPPSVYVGPQRNLLQTGSFDSGSDGSDGALVLTATGVITFSPTAFNPPLDPDGDYIYHFTDIYIGPGVTVVMKPPYLNAPVHWLASGTVQIDGVIDLNGEDGKPYSGIPADRQIAIPGAGGYSGGIYRWGSYLAQGGLGPGGGCAYNNTGIMNGISGNASHVIVGHPGACNIPGDIYGNVYLVPLVGGSGGGGNGSPTTTNRGSGGAGGGAVVIASSLSIAVNGAILANGGDRGGSQAGGGSGGAIHLISPVIGGTGLLTALGGIGGLDNGSYGRIRLEAFEHNFTGTVNPSANLGTPHTVFLPEHPPAQVRVVSISGVPTPPLPTGDFVAPDVTINASGTTTFTIEGEYVPLGSVVQLYAYSENGPDLIVNSTPLTGTFELSTATIVATLPSGYSRVFVRSDWTP